MNELAHPAFANHKVHHVGDLVGAIVTESLAQVDAAASGAAACRPGSLLARDLLRGSRG